MRDVQITESVKRHTLNFTDISANNNKYYNLELVKDSKGKVFIYTVYGRVGSAGAKEYRVCDDLEQAETETARIIKSKLKKGYVEIKLARSDIGSEAGKAKVDTTVSIESLKKAGIKITEEPAETSKLAPEVQSLVRTWFGVTQEFISLNLDTKKCPLGQLSLDQIDKAKQILNDARAIVSKKPDISELNKLTSLYYSNIPHILGSRINADLLRFDDNVKIDQAFDILDVFSDAKNVQSVISKKNAVDSQYATLNSDLSFVDSSDPTWKWIEALFFKTRARNHGGLGKMKVHNIFKILRKDEDKNFLKSAEVIAKECGKSDPSDVYAGLVKERPDVPKELRDLYKRANVLPGWHGTRRANMIGITTKGLRIRPSGVITAGSMYGDAIYYGHSSKACNYVDVKGSYWAQGNNKTGYLFLADCAFGNQKIARGSYMHTRENIKPYHSVWAKGGQSGVINDEMMLYNETGPQQQHILKYIIEFETQVK